MSKIRDSFRFLGALVLLSVIFLSSACQSTPKLGARVKAYQPLNVVTNQVAMDRAVQRVAVLPLVFTGAYQERMATTEMIRSVMRQELVKRGAFESVFLSEAKLASLAGATDWKRGETLAEGFFESLSDALACEAVLFPAVSHYHPYPPQTIAWKMRLIDCRSRQTIWEIDELFDSGNVSVAKAADQYYNTFQSGGTRHLDERSVLNSPRRFGEYTAAAVLGTLPY